MQIERYSRLIPGVIYTEPQSKRISVMDWLIDGALVGNWGDELDCLHIQGVYARKVSQKIKQTDISVMDNLFDRQDTVGTVMIQKYNYESLKQAVDASVATLRDIGPNLLHEMQKEKSAEEYITLLDGLLKEKLPSCEFRKIARQALALSAFKIDRVDHILGNLTHRLGIWEILIPAGKNFYHTDMGEALGLPEGFVGQQKNSKTILAEVIPRNADNTLGLRKIFHPLAIFIATFTVQDMSVLDTGKKGRFHLTRHSFA